MPAGSSANAKARRRIADLETQVRAGMHACACEPIHVHIPFKLSRTCLSPRKHRCARKQVAALENTVAEQQRLLGKKDLRIAELSDRNRSGFVPYSVQAAGKTVHVQRAAPCPPRPIPHLLPLRPRPPALVSTSPAMRSVYPTWRSTTVWLCTLFWSTLSP